MNGHVLKCKETNNKSNKSTITYTQGELRNAVQGHSHIHNNIQMGDAYRNQLYNQPSMSDMVIDWQLYNEANNGANDIEFECAIDTFDPMHVPEDQQSSNVQSNTDDLPRKYLNKMKRYEEYRDKMPPGLLSRQKFIYKNTLSTQATAYIELLKICSKHDVGRAMFDDIENWAYSHSMGDPTVFQASDRSQRWSYNKTLKHAKEVFHFNDLQPTDKEVTLHDGRVVSVPVVNFAQAMLSILDDPKVMASIMKGLDPETWRPMVPETEHELNENATIHDKDSGYLYRQGIKLHCPKDCDPVLVRPFPVLIHIDKSHSDLFGNLSVAPVQCMPAMIDIDAQQKVNAWRQIATIPNLSSGKGSDGQTSKSGLRNLEDYHKVMNVALSSFVECYENGGFYWTDEKGRTVLLKPYVHYFIGDIAGVNEMIGHYNNCKAQCLVKDCKCKQEDITSFPPKCSQVTWADIQACDTIGDIFDLYQKKGLVSEKDMSEIFADADFAKSISKHPIDNAFDRLPLSDPYQGIIGMTPQEMLHLMGCGIFKYLIFGVKDIIGLKKKKSRLKGLINDVFPDIKNHLSKNAERDVSPMSNRNGFFNVTSLTNEEIRGNFLGLLVLMNTTYGRDLLEPIFKAKDIDYDDMLETCKLVLAWERFHLDPQSRKDLLKAEKATWELQERMTRDIPREARDKTDKVEGSKGWTIAKFHAMSMISKLNLKLGCSKCFDSSSNEKNHKSFVKKPAGRTQRIGSKFSSQLAKCDFNRIVIERSYDHIKKFTSRDHSSAIGRNVRVNISTNEYDEESDEEEEDEESDDTADECLVMGHVGDSNIGKVSGQCAIVINIDFRKRSHVNYRWKSVLRRILAVSPCLHLHSTVGSYAIREHTKHNIPIPEKIHIESFTEATIRGIRYRANPYWKGGEWYDWAVVRFPETTKTKGGKTCLARIMGFFRYTDIGMLTYKHLEMESYNKADITKMRDDTLYAVFHCQTNYFKHEALEKTFFRKFSVTEHSEMYILPAVCIRGPMLVVPDIIANGEASQENYMTLLSRHHMGAYFRNHLDWLVDGTDVNVHYDYRDDW